MSVDNLQVIDFISEKDGRIVLTISDHLEWDDKSFFRFLERIKSVLDIMSVDNLQVIDFISEKDGRIVLTISDHLEWDDKFRRIESNL